MVTITLDDRDGAILERLQQGDATVELLAADVDCAPAYLRRRLPQLADNGLVRRVDDDGYAITENGARAIAASPAGARDDRIDTPEVVERRIESLDLRTDRAAAIRAAFSVLRYWGDTTAGEIVDAVYSEHPAGVASSAEWWTRLVRDRLGALPGVEVPGSSDRYWRYVGTPVVEKPTDDGRVAPGPVATGERPHPPGSARLAIERLDRSTPERSAVRAAFDHLVCEGEVSATELQSRIYPEHGAGYESAEEWWTGCVEPAFDALTGVEPAGDGRDSWEHRQSVAGSMSSDPGADLPDETLEASERGDPSNLDVD